MGAGRGRGATLALTVGVAAALVVPPVAAAPGGDPGPFFEVTPDVVVFEASDEIHGDEFWMTDGTTAGTRLIADVMPGLASFSPSRITRVGDRLFFVGNTPETGAELWSLDLDTFEARLVRDIEPGPTGSNPNGFVAVGDVAYFAARDSAEGEEVWKSDGTTAGTSRVTAVEAGNTSTVVSHLTLAGDVLAFFSRTSVDDELGLLDTTDDSFTRVDLEPGGTSFPHNFMAFGDHVYFTATTGATGSELWRTNGTVVGTTLVDDLVPGAGGSGAAPIGHHDGVLFASADDGATGRELYSTTGVGLTLVRDIAPGASSSSPQKLTSLGSRAVLTATTGDGTELWRTDGTQAGTTQVADIRPGPDGSAIGTFTVLPDGRALFAADDGSHGREVWVTDGTAAGTSLIGDLNPGPLDGSPSEVAPFRDGALIGLYRDRLDGDELWFTDGTPAGTRRILDINPGHLEAGSYATPVIGEDGRAWFGYWDGEHGDEPWVSDGTVGGTHLVADVLEGPHGSEPDFLATLGELALFSVDHPDTGRELWASDGTPGGTGLLKDIWPGPEGSWPGEVTVLGDHALFAAEDPAAGRELWITDGTSAGTSLFLDIDPGGDSDPRGLVAIDGRVWFSAHTATAGREPWTSDGTPGGTTMLADVRAGGDNSSPNDFTRVAGGDVVFTAYSDATGNELWSSDGTNAGTALLKDIRPGGSSNPGRLTAVDGTVFFRAFTDGAGSELWRTDGTGPGTVLAGDLNPGADSSSPEDLTVVGDRLVFTAFEPATGREPWIAGPTSAPARIVDQHPGAASTELHSVTHAFGRTLLAMDSAAVGHELWETDGTADGTSVFLDLRPGPASGSPTHLVPGSLWFSGWSDLTRARELYTMATADSVPIRVTGPAPFVHRFDGLNRAETAVQVSQDQYPDGAATVVLARQDTYPDSLAGGPLATHLNAPILLTRTDELTDVTKAEIERLGATRVVVLGGTAAVTQAVVDEVLADTAVTDEVRYAGDDRFETAALIADAFPNDGQAYVTEGANVDPRRGWPDAVSVSGLASATQRPILLVTRDRLPVATAGALDGLDAVLVGGAAAISEAVEDAVDDVAGATSRLSGPDRYATSAAVAEAAVAAGANDRLIHLATGANFPDALVAGPAVAAANSVLLLVHPTDITRSPLTASWLLDRAGTVEAVWILGGVGAVAASIEDAAWDALG